MRLLKFWIDTKTYLFLKSLILKSLSLLTCEMFWGLITPAKSATKKHVDHATRTHSSRWSKPDSEWSMGWWRSLICQFSRWSAVIIWRRGAMAAGGYSMDSSLRTLELLRKSAHHIPGFITQDVWKRMVIARRLRGFQKVTSLSKVRKEFRKRFWRMEWLMYQWLFPLMQLAMNQA